MTFDPSPASLSAVARPIPEPPPVTSEIFPCSSPGMIRTSSEGFQRADDFENARGLFCEKSDQQRRRGADDRLGAVGFVAPYFDFGARALALGMRLDDQPLWPRHVVAPHHVDQAQIHFPAVEEARPETLRHHFSDHA